MTAGFASWPEVLRLAHVSAHLLYQAPLDARPTWVRVVRVFKNGKLRLAPPAGSGADSFTADAAHLNRFRVPA